MSSSMAVCRLPALKAWTQHESGALLRRLRRHLSSSVRGRSEDRNETSGRPLPSSRLKFDDHREVFSHKTSWELLRGLLVLRICGMNLVADNALKIFRFSHHILGERILGWMLRPTVYAQFVAAGRKENGADRQQLRQEASFVSVEARDGLEIAAHSLKSLGLRLMVAPTLEGDIGEGGREDVYERNFQELLQLSELAWKFGGGEHQRKPCLQVKATALMSADVLKRLAMAFQEASGSEKMKMVEIMAQSAVNPTENQNEWVGIPRMNVETINAIRKGARRLGLLGAAAERKGLTLLVDAEFSYVNKAVSLLALAAMSVFNRDQPIVCNTIQCYFKEARNNLARELKISDDFGFCYGAKIVRGAYLEQERSIFSGEDKLLTCPSHSETGQNYKRVITHFMEYAASKTPGKCLIFVATHNEEGIRHAVDTMHSLRISPLDGRVVFAQIYGMAEQISMPLVRGGYIVYKSVPVGELGQVLPYLARRAAENRSVLLGARKERELLQSELLWRLKG